MTAAAPTTRPATDQAGSEARPVHADLDTALRYALAIGTLLVLMLPAARGSQSAIGWLPMWLVAMPAMAWWALHRFRLPSWRRVAPAEAGQAVRRRRRGAVQARRRARPAVIARPLPRVA